jgi:tRNA pseudouridine13 synthase
VIPKIDFDIGISAYSTDFPGCGGKIRISTEDFAVSEILSEKAQARISEKEGYPVYKLRKNHIDTTHALDSFFKKTGLRLKSLGLKDASAITEQYVCSMKKSKPISDFTSSKYNIKNIGSIEKPLSKKDMVGNKFIIKISDATSDISKFSKWNKILNFYGYQRFGSKRAVTHLIGKAIIQRDFEQAVNLLLSFTTKYDSKENQEIREKLSDKNNFTNMLEQIPPQMDLEKIALKEMVNSDNPLYAIRALPVHMRRFFVQAYQSFLFNKTLSMAFSDGENLFESTGGDVCYDKNGNLGKYQNDPEQRLAVPFVGYSYYKKTRFHYQISKILQDEEITPKDFFLKELQEASNEGGFRNSSIKCDNSSITGNTVTFTLSRGSFATIVLREIIKPEDPLYAGF